MNALAKRLSVVSNEFPDPPYSRDVMSKGYGFYLDVARMQNSDSWALCPAEVRPWMMMSWTISWEQHPCGSLPGDDELIAVRLGCSLEFLQVHRRFILRGWVRHSDGRLYHPVVTEEVLKMIAGREKWRVKKQGQRAKNQGSNENVPGDTTGSPGGVLGESPPSISISTSISTSSEEHNSEFVNDVCGSRANEAAPSRRERKPKPKPKPADLDLSILPADLSPDIWRDFVTHRQTIRKPLTTQTALKSIADELDKGRAMGLTPDAMLTEAISAGWQGVKAEWVKNRLNGGANGNGQHHAHQSAAERHRSINQQLIAAARAAGPLD